MQGRNVDQILGRWTEAAAERGLAEHSKAFFRAWHILDGLAGAQEHRDQVIAFIKANVKDTPERLVILEALQDSPSGGNRL